MSAFSADSLFIGKESLNYYYVKDTSNKPHNFIKLKSIKDSNNCLIIQHRMDKDTNGNKLTILILKSNINKTIKYDAYLFGYKNKKWIYTSSCPIRSNRSVFESWPHNIDSIMLTNFRYLDNYPDSIIQCN
jgi:hypothetical protein